MPEPSIERLREQVILAARRLWLENLAGVEVRGENVLVPVALFGPLQDALTDLELEQEDRKRIAVSFLCDEKTLCRCTFRAGHKGQHEAIGKRWW